MLLTIIFLKSVAAFNLCPFFMLFVALSFEAMGGNSLLGAWVGVDRP